MRNDNKSLVMTVVVGIILIMLFAFATAYAEESEVSYSTGDGIIIKIWQQGQFDIITITKIFAMEDVVMQIKIHGHPVKTDELEKALDFFGIHNAFNPADGRLNYLSILVELGLEVGNI